MRQRTVLAAALSIWLPLLACEPSPTEPDRVGTLTVRGTLTTEGVECQAMRGDDGRLYTLVGDLRGARAGDRVRVEGVVANGSICMQGTTLTIRRLTRLSG